VVCDVEPAVAVIVTVEVPEGVPVLPPLEEPELPPHPANPAIASDNPAAMANSRTRARVRESRELGAKRKNAVSANTATTV